MRSLLHYTTRTILRRLPTAPPWVGMSNEGELKEKILALSVDERNFVRCIFGLGQRRLSLSLSLSLSWNPQISSGHISALNKASIAYRLVDIRFVN